LNRLIEIVRLAKLLDKSDSEIKPGMIMTDAQSVSDIEAIVSQQKTLPGKLTNEAMLRANL